MLLSTVTMLGKYRLIISHLGVCRVVNELNLIDTNITMVV